MDVFSWEQRKLGEVCQINGRIGFRGYTEKDIIPKEQGGVLAFTPTNIVNNQLTLNVRNTYITRVKYDESPEIMVKNGNILFVKTGSTLGKSALVTGFTEDSTVNPQVVVIKTDIPNQKILSTILTTDKVQSQVASVKIGGAVPTMTETELKNIELSMPINEDERIKIGAFFSKLDNIITLHQRKYFSFDFNGESAKTAQNTISWEQRKLNEYLTVSTKKNTEDKYDKTDVLSVSGEVGVVNQIEFQGRSFAGASVSNYGVVETGDVVYTKSPLRANPYGIIKANKGKSGIVSTLYAVYKTIQGTANADFIECYFDLDDRLNMYLKPLVNIGAKHDMKVTDENALKGGVLFPSYEEQCQIADFFSRLDTLITLHQHKPNKKDTTL